MSSTADNKKRPVDDINTSESQVPVFPAPGATLYRDGKQQFRDNSESLQQLTEQALFLRPTQMGKSSLLDLAYLIYSNKEQCPKVKFQPPDKNSRFVFFINFLGASGSDVANVDQKVLKCVKGAVRAFLKNNPEIMSFYEEPTQPVDAGEYLQALADAVSSYGMVAGEQQSLLVLVDEYDKPVRDLLIAFIGQGDDQPWNEVKSTMQNYRSFFCTCKEIVDAKSKRLKGLKEVRVWVTGVVPVALNVISDFSPSLYTFDEKFADAIGLRDEDVDAYLDTVDSYLPFQDNQKQLVRDAVRNLANRLFFANAEIPLYHTRIVNGMMNALVDQHKRSQWLGNLSRLPGGIQFQSVPNSVFAAVSRQDQAAIRRVARDLTLDQEIESTLNEELELGDIMQKNMKVSDYLTLLVHLGIASVRKTNDGKTIFKATSTYFRIPFFERLLKNSLQPLFDAKRLEDLYAIGVGQVQEFMQTLPKTGMSSLIRWAEEKRENHILELQFQGYLIGELADSLWCEEVKATQEDTTDNGDRTDVRIVGGGTIIIFELKQKSTRTRPTAPQMKKHHKQLHSYMEELVKEEKGRNFQRRVAGFVVVMYNNGMTFEVQRTTYI